MDRTIVIGRRVADLREVMRREHLGACLLFDADPHFSEHVPDHWKSCEWISGLCDSGAVAVVTQEQAALWCDRRRIADAQFPDTVFQLMDANAHGAPTVAQWLGEQLTRPKAYTEVAVDGSTCSASSVERLITELRREGGLTLRTNFDALQQIWADRPPVPQSSIGLLPSENRGKNCREKLSEIRASLRKKHADGMLVARLDDIAWTLNLGGTEMGTAPFFQGYLLIDSKQATFFVNRQALSSSVIDYMRQESVVLDDYERVGQGLKEYFEYNILADPEEICYTLFKKITRAIVRESSPISILRR